MAVFLSNVCTFNSCGRKFASLHDLIKHIEENHSFDYEQENALAENSNHNTCIPISCILRIFSTNRSTDGDANDRKTSDSSTGAPQSLGSTPTDGSELDEDADSDSGQSSIDSWAASANADTSGNNALNKFHKIMGSTASGANLDENNNNNSKLNAGKEYICGFSGCTKRYRSSNSLSHHKRSVHKTMCINGSTPIAKPVIEEKEKKLFPCTQCSKTYKTSHGLKNHYNLQHNQANNQVNTTTALNRPTGLQQQLNGNSSNLAIVTSNGIQQLKPDHMPAQVTSFVQIGANNSTIKTEISPAVKESLLNSLQNTINKSKGGGMLVNGKFIKVEGSGGGGGGSTTTFPLSAELLSAGSTHEMADGAKLTHITIKSPPIISAPTLQQHLLSPIIPKMASS